MPVASARWPPSARIPILKLPSPFPLPPLGLVQGNLHQDGGFVFRDVKHPEQPVVEIALGRLRHGIGLGHVGVVDEARRALKAGDRHLLFRGRRRIVVEPVDRDGDAAAVGDQRLHLLLIDQPERLGLRKRRIALGIPEEHLEPHPAAAAIERRVHLRSPPIPPRRGRAATCCLRSDPPPRQCE